MEPLVVAGIAVASTFCISIILIGFFLLREEKFEDHIAQQTQQEVAFFTRPTSGKGTTKAKKKPLNRKKRHSETEGEAIQSCHDLNQHDEVESSVPVSAKDGKTEEGSEKPKSILKEKKNKAKKQALAKAEAQAAKERHTHFEDEPQPVSEEALLVQESVSVETATPELQSEPPIEPVIEEKPPQAEEETAINTEPQAPKKTKNKAKGNKEKLQVTDGEVNGKYLLNFVKTVNLSSSEVQNLIEVLLNKQGEDDQWKSTSKNDLTETLKKQLQEKEQLILEEKQQSLNTANKLKELREEIQQERLKQKSQLTAANNKITVQTKDIQALQARMKATHEDHTKEVQALQSQLRQFQEMVNSPMNNIQRLQEENAQLKNASMRASQLTADKESLTAELHKLQQSHRQVKSDLNARTEQWQKVDTMRQVLEKQVHDAKLHQSAKQEAEKALTKRLEEVNDELKKAEAKEASQTKVVEEQQKKCKALTDQLNKLKSSKVNEADALTGKLTEANKKVSELQKMFTSVETKLKESQETQALKDKEVQELQSQLKVLQETPVQNSVQLSNHVDKGDASKVSLDTHNELLKGKDSEISKLNNELNSRNEEIENLKEDIEQQKKKQDDTRASSLPLETHNKLLMGKDSEISKLNNELHSRNEEIEKMKEAIEQQKTKNNDLRTKNWKAMEALSATEQSVNAQIAKAVEAAKAKEAEETSKSKANTAEKDKLEKELSSVKEQLKKMEEIVEQQKRKNNDLREKNWKAMDAVSAAEKSAKSQVQVAVESVKRSNQKNLESERSKVKDVLMGLYSDIQIDSSLAFENWLVEFEKNVAEMKPTIVENGDISNELEESRRESENLRAECSHYKNVLEDTESMLRKLENQVESEIGSWEKKLEASQQETRSANAAVRSLEKDLSQAQSSSKSHLDKIKSLEKEILEAKKRESDDNSKISSLEKELSLSKNQSEKISKLEIELSQYKENESKLNDSIKSVESVQGELIMTVKQLSDVQGQLTTKDSEVKSLREEMKRNQEYGEGLKKKIASLEEALNKANEDVGRSQESLNSEHSSGSPDKKKKGLKGAFSKLAGGSKKDKESKNADKEETLKQISAYKAEIEELKAENKKLRDSEMTRSQQIEKDMADAIADAAAKATAENKVSSI